MPYIGRTHYNWDEWPKIRVEWDTGFLEVPQDFLLHGPKVMANRILKFALANGGWKVIQEPKTNNKGGG